METGKDLDGMTVLTCSLGTYDGFEDGFFVGAIVGSTFESLDFDEKAPSFSQKMIVGIAAATNNLTTSKGNIWR